MTVNWCISHLCFMTWVLRRTNSADKRFEVDGANAASRLLHTHDYRKTNINIVWHAIALHPSRIAHPHT